MLFKLLTLPLTAPISALTFVGEKVRDAALAQVYDVGVIKQELLALEVRLDRGEMTEEEFETLEMALIERLQEANRRLRASGPG
jgi:Gas vesicle protein G